MSFLVDREARDLTDQPVPGVRPKALFLGNGPMGLEVAHYESPRTPSAPQLRELHDERKQRRAAPVLVVVTHSGYLSASSTRLRDLHAFPTRCAFRAGR